MIHRLIYQPLMSFNQGFSYFVMLKREIGLRSTIAPTCISMDHFSRTYSFATSNAKSCADRWLLSALYRYRFPDILSP
uniref:Uncharacterized protein n=1 Tax=Meloidogyne incognita TaxID=6306 RepID=A0A914MKQ7_MELIC